MKSLFKFAIVGGIGFLINTFILYILTDKFNLFYALSAIVSIQSAVIVQFLLNNSWTFHNNNKLSLFKKFIKYESVNIFGTFLNYIILIFLTEIFGIYYLLSNLISVFVVFLFNYYNSKKFVWDN